MRDRRMICRSSFTSKKLAKCNDSEHLLFYGLILHADDEGRGDGDPVTIALQLANRRWSEELAGQMLDRLRTLGLVSWYTVDGELYFEVADFDKYQQGAWQGKHKRESSIPPEKYARKHQHQCTGTLEAVQPDTGFQKSVAKLMECNVMECKEVSDVETPDPPLFDEDSDAYELASFLIKMMLKNNPKAKAPDLASPAGQKWCLVFDRMIRLDKLEPGEIAAIILWSQEHDFWKCNILSPGKLREKWNQLYLQAKQDGASLKLRRVNERVD